MKKFFQVLIIIVVIASVVFASSVSAGLFGGDKTLTTKSGTKFVVPSDDVSLISDDDGIEVYGLKNGESFYYAIVLNYSKQPDTFGELVNVTHSGKLYEEDGVYFYEEEYQGLGNAFNYRIGNYLVMKDKQIDSASDVNVHTGEAVFFISSNYVSVVRSMKTIEWSQ